MLYTIETSQGFVKAISTVGGELNKVTEYTNDRASAKTFTMKRIKDLRAKSFFKYYDMAIIITEVTP